MACGTASGPSLPERSALLSSSSITPPLAMFSPITRASKTPLNEYHPAGGHADAAQRPGDRQGGRHGVGPVTTRAQRTAEQQHHHPATGDVQPDHPGKQVTGEQQPGDAEHAQCHPEQQKQVRATHRHPPPLAILVVWVHTNSTPSVAPILTARAASTAMITPPAHGSASTSQPAPSPAVAKARARNEPNPPSNSGASHRCTRSPEPNPAR